MLNVFRLYIHQFWDMWDMLSSARTHQYLLEYTKCMYRYWFINTPTHSHIARWYNILSSRTPVNTCMTSYIEQVNMYVKGLYPKHLTDYGILHCWRFFVLHVLRKYCTHLSIWPSISASQVDSQHTVHTSAYKNAHTYAYQMALYKCKFLCWMIQLSLNDQ